MSIIKTLNNLFRSKDLAYDIYRHYKKTKLMNADLFNRDEFIKICMTNHIDLYPIILFDFFDISGIKIAIYPVESTEFWSCRIHNKGKITICNHYTNRLDAVLGGIEMAINIYENKNENDN